MKAAGGLIDPYHVAMVGASEPGDGGAGVRVALIDTGLFSNDVVHPDLASGARTVERVSLVGDRNDPNDSSGHGTRMAGLIAGANPVCAPGSTRASPAGRYGIAPNASLLSIRIGDADPDVALAVEALDLALRGGCAVINISFGFARVDGDARAGFRAAVERCLAQGAVVLASAGNNGEMTFPASCPGVLAIGALSRMERPLAGSPRPDASGRGVDLVAPGEMLITSRLRQVPASSACSHDTVSFTSPACAVASGVAALYASNHGLRGADLRQKLIDTARALPVVGADARKVGRGLVRYQSPHHS